MSLAVASAASSLWAAETGDSVTSSLRLNEVVVTGVRGEADARRLPASVTVVGRETLEQSHETSILQVLNTEVPGFFSTSRGVMGYGVSTGGSGQMSVRGVGGAAQSGLPTTALMVLIDGHPQYMGLMGHPIADAYQSLLAERVEVLRGPASALYGSNAMGGVINIVTRQAQPESHSARLRVAAGSYGSFESEISGSGRHGGFSDMLAASYNRSDGHRANMGYEQANLYAKLGYEFSRHWNATLCADYSHFNATNPGAADDLYYDNNQCIKRYTAAISVNNSYGGTQGSISLFHNWGRHWINDGYQAGEEPLDYRFNSRDNMSGLSIYQSLNFFTGNRTTIGFDYFHFGGKAWNEYVADGARSYLVDKAMDEVAGYIDFWQAITANLTIGAGARVDHHSRTGTEFVPQAGVAVNLPDNTDVKISASRGYRNPTIREMYMFAPQNPDLEPESLWSYELSSSHASSDGKLSAGANLFYIKGDNIIMRAANPNGSGMLNQNSGEIENWGTEITASYTFNRRWSLSGSYSWLHMENPVLASPESKLCLTGRFTSGRWTVQAVAQYVAGLYTDLDEAATEEFFLLDLQCDFRPVKAVSLYVKEENLLAQRYEIMAGYPMPRATAMAGVAINF